MLTDENVRSLFFRAVDFPARNSEQHIVTLLPRNIFCRVRQLTDERTKVRSDRLLREKNLTFFSRTALFPSPSSVITYRRKTKQSRNKTFSVLFGALLMEDTWLMRAQQRQ